MVTLAGRSGLLPVTGILSCNDHTLSIAMLRLVVITFAAWGILCHMGAGSRSDRSVSKGSARFILKSLGSMELVFLVLRSVVHPNRPDRLWSGTAGTAAFPREAVRQSTCVTSLTSQSPRGFPTKPGH